VFKVLFFGIHLLFYRLWQGIADMHEPTLAIYHKHTWGNRLLTWFAATRPAFFSASLLAVTAGLALAWHIRGEVDGGLALLTVLAVICFHAGANVLNDYYDHDNDTRNQERIYPFSGGSRFLQNQVLSLRETFWLGSALLAVGIGLGLWVVYLSGPLLLLIGVVGAALAVFYSAPPCLVCRGLGDLTIILTFGILPVAGSVWIQLGEIPTAAWWLGAIAGIFTAAILWINSIPDISADQAAGKRTLPARLGARHAPYGLAVLFGTGFLLIGLAPLPALSLWALVAILPAVQAVFNSLRGHLFAAIPQVLLTHAAVCLILTISLGFAHS
jgi:1,4-dihydroxy-2-naphthoate polyprenyltransferase